MKHLFVVLIATAVIIVLGCSEDSPTEADNQPVGDTIRVPANEATLQSALDKATEGQMVLVSAGTYSGPGNRDLNFKGKVIMLKSVSGPASTIIDCQDTGSVVHQGFYFSSSETYESVVDGFSIINAYAPNGAGMGFRSSSPTIRSCIFADNVAYASGGAVHCKSASPTFINCTMVNNASPAGGAVFLIAGSSPHFERCILSFSSQGEAVYCSYSESQPTFTCCDIYGNSAGDWVDCIEGLDSSNGNLSEDPAFCNMAQGDYRLQDVSPCSPLNNTCSVQIGAMEVGCSP